MAVKKSKTPVQRQTRANVNKKTSQSNPLGFHTTSEFYGYRNKEDVTNLPPGYLVSPSRNVFVNTSGLVQSRPGYTLYGQANTGGTGFKGSFTWDRGVSGQQTMRAGNNKVQYPYTAIGGDSYRGTNFVAGQTYWIDLLTGTASDYWNFTKFFETNESLNVALGVNQSSQITEWTGGVGSIKFSSNASILATSGSSAATFIEIICGSSVTSLSGSTTTAGNYVVTGSYVNTNNQTVYGGFIIVNNNPANNDTLTLVINGISIVTTFKSSLTYDYNQVHIESSAALTLSNVTRHLQYPAALVATSSYTGYGGFSAFPASQIPYIQYSTYSGSMNVQGTVTTVGNSVQTNVGNSSILMPINPANNSTMILNLNGISITFTFVSVIGANPGNVLIAATPALTQANLLALLQAPQTTNATQVALSAQNQGVVNAFTWASTATLTLNGNYTWAQLGFYAIYSDRSVSINGNTYKYSGGESTNTITGVLPDPTGEALGSVVHQLPVTVLNSNMTTLPATFRNDLIQTLNNQVYVGSLQSNTIYKSKVNSYVDYSQASPRLPGDGYTAAFDGLVNAMYPQEATMYVSWGISGWTTVDFTLSADLAHESVTFTPLKVAPLQTALSQGLVTNIGNDLVFITDEPTLSSLGRVAASLDTPQITNMSDPIKNDMDSYTATGFLDGHIVYTKYYIYVSLPSLGLVRKFNIVKDWWEPPLNLPVGRFSVINGLVYGHSYLTDESYQLETGNNDNGNPIHSIAAFSYENFGDRVEKKVFNEWYVEGYVSANTTISSLVKFELGGFGGIQTFQVQGTGMYPSSPSATTIFQTIADGSLGKNPMGLYPIGSVTDSLLNLPKFRVIFTMIPTGFFEYQPYFETNDIDFNWAILAYGNRLQQGAEPNEIRI